MKMVKLHNKEAYNVLNTIFNLQKITPDGNLIVIK